MTRAGEDADGTVARADCAKQTQLPRAGRKETPAAKATSPAVTGDKRAKQSQFPVGGHPWTRGPAERPVHPRKPTGTEACETNPIAPERYEGQVLYGK